MVQKSLKCIFKVKNSISVNILLRVGIEIVQHHPTLKCAKPKIYILKYKPSSQLLNSSQSEYIDKKHIKVIFEAKNII